MHFNTKPSFFARFDSIAIVAILVAFLALAFLHC